MPFESTIHKPILPRSRPWWLGLALLLVLAGWLYLRGYNVSLPFIKHVDEPHHLLAAQHTIDDGSARGVNHEAYPPGMRTLNYLLLKHVKSAEDHYGTMLPALRLITITTWMLVVVVIALLGSMISHPLTGLMAAAIWIVNPWVVERAHYALPDAYVTLFTLLALWLALVSCLHGRRSCSTAAVYSIMLAIVFKTQAIFVAPLVLLMPMLNWRRVPAWRKDAWRQTFWNCLRFSIFLFWLLLIYPTLESFQITNFAVKDSRASLPSIEYMAVLLKQVLETFHPLLYWTGLAAISILIWRYRQRANLIVCITIFLAAVSWLAGLSMFTYRGSQLRQLFALGALIALLYATSITGLIYMLEETLTRRPPPPDNLNSSFACDHCFQPV